jgi:phosphohistidine phosphatase SixA
MPQPTMHRNPTRARRGWLAAAIALAAAPALQAATPAPLQADANADDEFTRLLRAGGVVLALRHAVAPGTFDPPGFRLGDCATQRNLSDEGRAQARRIGRWFADRRLVPARVRSSPWCRCLDTANGAFGRAEAWAALGSPHGRPETTNAEHLAALRAALVQAASGTGAFEVWVTHNFVLQALAGTGAASGEGLLLQAATPGTGGAGGSSGPGGPVRVLGRLAPP